METSGSVEPSAPREVPVPTGAGWLQERAPRKPTLSEEFGSLDVLCDMEFKEDFVKLFEKSLRTLPSVGLPTLLAYRRDSSRENVQIETEEDSAPRCEYCGSLLKPFPLLEDVCPPPQDYQSQFCCERNRDLYEFIVNERRNCEGARSVPVAAGPRESHGPGADGLLAEERAYRRQQEREMARQLAFLAAEPTSAAERSTRAGTISYLLSREPPSPAGWTLVPGESAAEPSEQPVSCSVACCGFVPVGRQGLKNELLEKYYKHGGKFLTMLPDGTAQLLSMYRVQGQTERALKYLVCNNRPPNPRGYEHLSDDSYPSGNLAIIVIREKNQLTCIVQEDKPSNSKVRAVFESNGRSTCYYPNGAEWITMSIQGGQYLDQAGSRVRRWMWPNGITSSGPHVPLSPIFISLNRHVGVRILGQDKIVVSFLAIGQQAKFNVGTKVQVSDGGRLPAPAQLDEDELLLLAFRVRILRLFDRLRGCLNFPSNEQRDKIKPPAYLITQTLKILQLCTTSGISDELRSSVRAIVNAQV